MRTPAPARPSNASDDRGPAAVAALVAGLWMLATPLAVFAQAPAQDTPGEPRIRFDIPARPLSAAIEAYALATGVQVLYDRPPGDTQRSTGVVGLYTREAALRALLAGTGLHPDFAHGDSVVLRPDEDRSVVPDFGPPPSDVAIFPLDTLEVRGEAIIPAVTGDRVDLQFYGGVVRGAVRQALLNDRLTASGRYQVTIKLWIAPSGAIERMVAADSSGDLKRDQAIAAVVQRVVVNPPPPEGLRQPVVLVVHSRPGA